MNDKTKSSVKISFEEARSELIDFLEESGVETETSVMTDDDKAAFEKIIKVIVNPLTKGRAIIDGDKYVLTLKKELGGLKEISVSEPTAKAWLVMDKVNAPNKPNAAMFEFVRHIAGLEDVMTSDLKNMAGSDFKVAQSLATLFLA